MWYGSAAFFKEYYPFFESTYSKKWERLIDLNIHIIKYILQILGIDTEIILESDIGTTASSTKRIVEICRKLRAEKYLSGIGGRAYLQEAEFKDNGIGLEYQHFVHPAYSQLFTCSGNGFMPYMSVIDLLFNEGPKSLEIIRGGNG